MRKRNEAPFSFAAFFTLLTTMLTNHSALADTANASNEKVTTEISAEETTVVQEHIGPWTLSCTREEFPTAQAAKDIFHAKPSYIDSCEAAQTIEGANQVHVTFQLTPARIEFQTTHFEGQQDAGNKAELIVGEIADTAAPNAPKVKEPQTQPLQANQNPTQFDLIGNCYTEEGAHTCTFIASSRKENDAVLQASQTHEKLNLLLSDVRYSQPLVFTFDLQKLNEVYPRVADTYRQMEAVLHRLNPGNLIITEDKWLATNDINNPSIKKRANKIN